MKIYLKQIGKRYRSHWIFRGVDYTFESGKSYALLGANGSGKSTLLRIIAGMQNSNKGTVSYESNATAIANEKIFQKLSFCAPGMDIVEEMTLKEFLNFHFTFKKIRAGFTVEKIIGLMGLADASNKFIHEFSSGMKQRVKLAQTFFSDTNILLLDEPCSNLDLKGVEMYQDWLNTYCSDRLVIIASNDEREYLSAGAFLSMTDYK